jgi:hypothetical protein
VRATTSQAIDATMARSRGGKDRLAAAAGIVLEDEPAFGPALSPPADGVGMEIELNGGRHVGKRGGFVEEQDQTCTSPEVRRRGASEADAPGLGEELIREGRAMMRWGARQMTAPRANGRIVFSDDPPIIAAASEGRKPYRYL